jgi:hypothetical protein
MTVTSDNSMAIVYFNESILFSEEWTTDDIEVSIIGPKMPY